MKSRKFRIFAAIGKASQLFDQMARNAMDKGVAPTADEVEAIGNLITVAATLEAERRESDRRRSAAIERHRLRRSAR